MKVKWPVLKTARQINRTIPTKVFWKSDHSGQNIHSWTQNLCVLKWHSSSTQQRSGLTNRETYSHTSSPFTLDPVSLCFLTFAPLSRNPRDYKESQYPSRHVKGLNRPFLQGLAIFSRSTSFVCLICENTSKVVEVTVKLGVLLLWGRLGDVYIQPIDCLGELDWVSVTPVEKWFIPSKRSRVVSLQYRCRHGGARRRHEEGISLI